MRSGKESFHMISRTSGGNFGKRWNSVRGFWGREITARPLFPYSRLRSFIFDAAAFLTGKPNGWKSSRSGGTINIANAGKGSNLPTKIERNI